MLHRQWPLSTADSDVVLLKKHRIYVLLSNLSLFYISLPTDILSAADIRIVSRLFFLIVSSGYDFEIVCRMNCIDNAVFGYYKALSFLSYLIRNMDIFLLIFQPSEFLSIYTIVITKQLPYFRPRFSVLSPKSDALKVSQKNPLSSEKILDSMRMTSAILSGLKVKSID